MEEEVLRARGHENVTATHGSTFEVTSDDWLTPAGDCIVGVEADRVPADFSAEFVRAAQDADATIRIELSAGDQTVTVTARGDPDLSFESERSLVVRTSDYVDERTVAVGAEAAAGDLDRGIVTVLQDEATELVCRLSVE